MRAVVAFALVLVGCGSFDPAHQVRLLDSDLFDRCGWHALVIEDRTPPTECRVYRTDEPSCGLLPDGVSPCDMEPGPELRVEAGEIPGEWYRSSDKLCRVKFRACD